MKSGNFHAAMKAFHHLRNLLAALLLTGLLPLSVQAHESRPAYLVLTQESGDHWLVSFKQPQIQGSWLNLGVTTNCEAGQVTSHADMSALEQQFRITCTSGQLDEIRITNLDRTLTDAMVTVTRLNGDTSNHLVKPTEPILRLSGPAPSVPAYLLLGIEHLLFGLDHVLFILALMYIIRSLPMLLATITGFTVAHSVTLGLSATGMITIPNAPVEALIAMSIVLVVREHLLPVKSTLSHQPWLLALAFGLLHGLGFAGALAETGLPENGQLMALFLFNVGIEAGQLLIVLIALGVANAVRRSGWQISRAVEITPLWLTGCIAMFWFIQRSASIISG
ncbi:MAG: HupE/UreJ family protein [Pseudomonadales bacterium]|nr:HupE/UreJ family protein [Pseudomonadales bacterium]